MYHFRVKIIGRGKGGGGSAASAAAYRAGGRNGAAALAYRSGDRLRDPRTGQIFDYSAKAAVDQNGFGILHAEILLPPGAPVALADRQELINAVEAAEKRRDAQLFRELEISLPRELNFEQQRDLVRAFVAATFVTKGMIADIAIHDERASDGGRNPHAHVLLTMRQVTPEGFGRKERAWNNPALIHEWREAWARMANEVLEANGFEARLDHRSHHDRGIMLEPDQYLGPQKTRGFDGVIAADRREQRSASKQRNLDAIIEEPAWLFDAITREKATFTARDIERALIRYTGVESVDPEFSGIMAHVATSAELVSISTDQPDKTRFTTREMLNAEMEMAFAARQLASRKHGRAAPSSPAHLSAEQATAYRHVLEAGDLALISGVAGAGKTTVLRDVVAALESVGHNVRGAAIAGAAARKLADETGIAAGTIAGMIKGWDRRHDDGMPAPRNPLERGDVLIVDEAAMVDSRTMRRLLSEAANAGAKVVLVGDSQQLQAIGAGAAFRALEDTHGGARLSEVRRQDSCWMREATKNLAAGNVAAALAAYRNEGRITGGASRTQAMCQLVAAWAADRAQGGSQLIMSYFRDDVDALNVMARQVLRAEGVLGADIPVVVKRQERDEFGEIVEHAERKIFATGDQLLFLKNDRKLDVQNGLRGVVEALSASGDFTVKLGDGRTVSFNAIDYPHITQGYASTVHKAQGQTIDRAYVLASYMLDAHATYVAMSRHRKEVSLFYSRDEFENDAALSAMLGRPRPKDSTLDYLPTPARRERTEGGLPAGDGRRGRPQPQPTPTAAFIAAHTTPRAATALEIVRANAAKRAARSRSHGQERELERE